MIDFADFTRFGFPQPQPPGLQPFDGRAVQRQALGAMLLGAPLGDLGAIGRGIGQSYQVRNEAQARHAQAQQEAAAAYAKQQAEEEERRLRLARLMQQMDIAGETQEMKRKAAAAEAESAKERLERQRAYLDKIPERYRAEAELQLGSKAFDSLLERISAETAPLEVLDGPYGAKVMTRGAWESVVKPPAPPKPPPGDPVVKVIDGVKMVSNGRGGWSRVPEPQQERGMTELAWLKEVNARSNQIFDETKTTIGEYDENKEARVAALRQQARAQAEQELAPYRPAKKARQSLPEVVTAALAALPPAEKAAAEEKLSQLLATVDPAAMVVVQRRLRDALAGGMPLSAILRDLEADMAQ